MPYISKYIVLVKDTAQFISISLPKNSRILNWNIDSLGTIGQYFATLYVGVVSALPSAGLAIASIFSTRCYYSSGTYNFERNHSGNCNCVVVDGQLTFWIKYTNANQDVIFSIYYETEV